MRGLLAVTVFALMATGSACLFPALDGLTGSDASMDAAVDQSVADQAADAADARFCSLEQDAIFCDDFDDADTISTAWRSVVSDASVSIIQDDPLSPANCLQVSVPAGSLAWSSEAYLARTVPVQDGKTLVFGAALRTDAWPSGNYGTILTAYTDQTHAASIVLNGNEAQGPWLNVNDDPDSGAISTHSLPAFPSGWFRCDIAIAVTGSTSTIDVLVNGVTVSGPFPGPPIDMAQVTVSFGFYANDYSSTLQWSIDDTFAALQ